MNDLFTIVSKDINKIIDKEHEKAKQKVKYEELLENHLKLLKSLTSGTSKQDK